MKVRNIPKNREDEEYRCAIFGQLIVKWGLLLVSSLRSVQANSGQCGV